MSMTSDELRRVAEIGSRFLETEQTDPVAGEQSPSRLRHELQIRIPDDGRQDQAFFDLLDRVVQATPRTSSRAFFNQLFAGRSMAATSADMLSSLLNVSMYTFQVAGPHILLEQEVLTRMCEHAGFADGRGTLTPGGSMSNLGAMIMARNQAGRDLREDGVASRMTLYTSREAHYSVIKNAGMIGTGRNNVRHIAVDEAARMRPDALARAIEADRREGCVPFMINATAGTTVQGAFDPIDEIAGIAQANGIWLHVDGAFGGSVLLSPTHRHLLAGCERADSITWDAHKMMGVPLIGSALLVRDPVALKRHFDEEADYLFQADSDDLNPGRVSMQCGRRNDAFKIWAAWQYFGQNGMARRIDRLFELANHARNRVVDEDGLELSLEPESVNICFEVAGRCSANICELLDRERKAMVGTGLVNGRRTIRLVCVNPDLTESDIDVFFEHIAAVAPRARQSDNIAVSC